MLRPPSLTRTSTAVICGRGKCTPSQLHGRAARAHATWCWFCLFQAQFNNHQKLRSFQQFRTGGPSTARSRVDTLMHLALRAVLRLRVIKSAGLFSAPEACNRTGFCACGFPVRVSGRRTSNKRGTNEHISNATGPCRKSAAATGGSISSRIPLRTRAESPRPHLVM